MIAEFIEPRDPRWMRFLSDSPHDFYHFPEYLEFAAKHEGGTPVAFYAELNQAKFLAPLLIKQIPEAFGYSVGWYDATTPYGYPAPILLPSNDKTSLGRFIESFRDVASEQGIIASFSRLHPLLPLPTDVLEKYGTLVTHGNTVFVDTSLPSEEIASQIRYGHRADVRKLVKQGFRIEMDNWAQFNDFASLYKASMERVSAADHYKFSDSYFEDLRRALEGCLHLCTVVSPDGEVASAGLFTKVGDIVQYHLSGSSDKYLHLAPSKLMLEFVTRWAKQVGCSYFHLGGGVGAGEDHLFRFKAGFSRSRASFLTYRMIIDEEKYSTLVRRHIEQASDINELESGFFPLYRAPGLKPVNFG